MIPTMVQRVTIRDPKSGKDEEVVFIPRRLAGRLRDYIREEHIDSDQKIFPITYSAARLILKRAGEMVGVHLRLDDLGRHAATYASRSGAPIEIVSKGILRHANLKSYSEGFRHRRGIRMQERDMEIFDHIYRSRSRSHMA